MSLSEFLEGLRKERGPGASASAFTFDMEFVDTNKGEEDGYLLAH